MYAQSTLHDLRSQVPDRVLVIQDAALRGACHNHPTRDYALSARMLGIDLDVLLDYAQFDATLEHLARGYHFALPDDWAHGVGVAQAMTEVLS